MPINNILKNTRETLPLTHAITNYVTVNDCANIILAAGGSPIMADDIHEVADITKICHSLVINMGTLNENTIEAMVAAGIAANEVNHPVILDPVAVGASDYRNKCAKLLLEKVKFAVIRGNISEIKALALGSGNTSGVDASAEDIVTEENLDAVVDFCKKLSKETNSVIAVSGKYDIIADHDHACVVTNGVEEMTKITGSGCMLTSVIGTFCGANPQSPFEAAIAAICALGLCGEAAKKKMSEEKSGLSSFRMHMIDSMSVLDEDTLLEGAKYDIR